MYFFRRLMKVLVILCCVASVIGQTKYCCTPPQWESYNYFMQGKADHGKVSVISGNESVSVDVTNQLINSQVNISINTGVNISVRVLIDYNNKMQYTIQDKVCTPTPTGEMPPMCIPDSAKFLTNSYYGTPSNQVNVTVYMYDQGPNTLFVTVEDTGCTPVLVAAYGTAAGVSAISEKTYGNFSLGIKDRSVFDIPHSCVHQPSRGPVPTLHNPTFF